MLCKYINLSKFLIPAKVICDNYYFFLLITSLRTKHKLVRSVPAAAAQGNFDWVACVNTMLNIIYAIKKTHSNAA